MISAANDGREPIVTDAALRMNVRFSGAGKQPMSVAQVAPIIADLLILRRQTLRRLHLSHL